MIPSNTQIISFVQQQLPQDYHINFSQIDDHTVVGHSDNFDDTATVMWQTYNNGCIMTIIESKLALSRAKALQAVNDFNAKHDFKSHILHLYLKDDNRVAIYMKRHLREDSEEYVKKWVGDTTLIGLNILGWWNDMCTEDAKAKMQAEEEARRRAEEEAKKKAEEEMEREAEEKRPNFFADFLEVAKKTAELEVRKKEEEKKEAERQEREAKRKAEEKANENKGLSLLKGLFGKKKSSVNSEPKARGSVDKVIDDTVTRTIGGVTIRTSMKTILQEAAQGLKKSLYQEKENVFRLSSFRTGQFHYSYYREEKGFDVAVSFKSNEFENKEIAEKMRLDIKDYLKSQGFDDCEVVETKKVLIRKDIILRDKKEGDLIARIQNTTNLLIDVVQKIDGWRGWPEDQFHKRQRLMTESRRKIEELRSRVADCEADCARHKRDSYYIQKRADAKAALQKEKLRYEKLDSGVDLDEID